MLLVLPLQMLILYVNIVFVNINIHLVLFCLHVTVLINRNPATNIQMYWKNFNSIVDGIDGIERPSLGFFQISRYKVYRPSLPCIKHLVLKYLKNCECFLCKQKILMKSYQLNFLLKSSVLDVNRGRFRHYSKHLMLNCKTQPR